MRFSHLQYILFLIILISCSEGPKNEDSRIDESLVINKDISKDREYSIDSAGSFISWSGTNDQISHYGIFHIDHGYITITDSIITGGEIYINLSDLNILDLKDNPEESSRLLAFMKSNSFFDIRNFPQAKFEIDSVVAINVPLEERIRSKRGLSSDPTDNIYGRLTLKGISKPINFPARIELRYFSLQGSARFSINRNNWKLRNPPDQAVQSNGYLPDSIEVGFDIIANAH
jgi:polyisoprenoid-binding protein YceI